MNSKNLVTHMSKATWEVKMENDLIRWSDANHTSSLYAGTPIIIDESIPFGMIKVKEIK